MMNAPPAVAQRLPVPGGGTGPAPRPAPAPPPAPVPKKQLAKMTMIGVAPPSPGAVAPPAAKPDLKPGVAQGSAPPSKPSGPPGQAAPRPSSPPVARQSGSHPPVNPFGGTMLMGAAADVSVGSQAGSVDAKDSGAQPDVGPAAPAPAAVISSQEQAAALSTTTPSVAPPEPVNHQKLPSEMPTVASAVSPSIGPGPAAASAVAREPAPPVAQPEWNKQIAASTADPLAVAKGTQTSAAGSLAIAPRQDGPSLVLLVVFGIFSLGVYPLVVWLARKRRSKA